MKQLSKITTAMLADNEIKTGTAYVSPKLTVRVSRIHYKANGRKPRKDGDVDLRVRIGRPNYAERQFIEKCKAAGEPFPVKKIQFKFFRGAR